MSVATPPVPETQTPDPGRGRSQAYIQKVKRRVAAARERRTWSEVVRSLERALYVARRRTGLTLRGLGEAAGGMDYAAVNMAIKRFVERLARDKALRTLTERLLDGSNCEM